MGPLQNHSTATDISISLGQEREVGAGRGLHYVLLIVAITAWGIYANPGGWPVGVIYSTFLIIFMTLIFRWSLALARRSLSAQEWR